MLPNRRRVASAAAAAIAIAAFSVAGPGCGRESRTRPAAGVDSTQVTRQRLAWLEGARSFGGGELQRDLRHPDARVRRAAAMALGRIQDIAALQDLLPLLEDPDSSVAFQAGFAIGQLQGYDEPRRHAAQIALVALVADHPVARNAVFVEALGKVGGPEVVTVLEQGVATGLIAAMQEQARDPVLEGLAALALGRVKTKESRFVLTQVGDLRGRDVGAAWRIGAAMMADPDTAFFVPCVSLLEHPHKFARAQGARTLGRLGDRRAFHPLTQHLADLDWEVRASILTAIATLADPKHPDREAFDFSASLTTDSHPLVREAAVAALDSFGAAPREAALRERLADPVAAVRLGAARALVRADGARARDVWEAARRDSVEFVRTEILKSAWRALGDAAGLETLQGALRSTNVKERTAAAEAFGGGPRTQRAAVRAALEAALGDADFVVAATAASAIGAQGLDACMPALAAAYDAHQKLHNDVDVRLAVIEAVGEMAKLGGPAGARALCERARDDRDVRIAAAARLALAKLDGKPQPPPAASKARDVAIALDSLPPIDLGLVRVRLVTPRGDAVLELDGNDYPRTVGNFLRLVDAGFYERGVFHRVVPSFVVQGGCPRGDGWGDAGSFLPCEYGDLRYDDAGVVGMAHAGKDTGGSQFFITHVPVPRLDGAYTAFGRVREGMDVVDRIVRGDSFRIERIPIEPTARR